MEFIDRLEWLCRKNHIKYKQLLSDCNLSKNSISNWKKGIIPVLSTQSILAQYFGVTVDYLMGRTESPFPQAGNLGEVRPYEKRGKRPIIGMASAGTGVIAEEMVVGWQSVDEEFDTEEFFWLQVTGDSMSPKIDHGDLVLVQKDTDIDNGNIAVVMVEREDGWEGFIKQAYFDIDAITLHSFNPYYPDMVFTGDERKKLRFVGKARKVERDL